MDQNPRSSCRIPRADRTGRSPTPRKRRRQKPTGLEERIKVHVNRGGRFTTHHVPDTTTGNFRSLVESRGRTRRSTGPARAAREFCTMKCARGIEVPRPLQPAEESLRTASRQPPFIARNAEFLPRSRCRPIRVCSSIFAPPVGRTSARRKGTAVSSAPSAIVRARRALGSADAVMWEPLSSAVHCSSGAPSHTHGPAIGLAAQRHARAQLPAPAGGSQDCESHRRVPFAGCAVAGPLQGHRVTAFPTTNTSCRPGVVFRPDTENWTP
jgi:hypothetical protein